VLSDYRPLAEIHEPGTLDGGDVLILGNDIYIGVSSRTNIKAVNELASLITPFGYILRPVKVRGCLHLKSAVTKIKDDCVLINPSWIDKDNFKGYGVVNINPTEPYAANALLVGDSLIYPTVYPKTLSRLLNLDLKVKNIDMSELIKAEGAVTCCSVIFIGDA
jgi:dimethylargininase